MAPTQKLLSKQVAYLNSPIGHNGLTPADLALLCNFENSLDALQADKNCLLKLVKGLLEVYPWERLTADKALLLFPKNIHSRWRIPVGVDANDLEILSLAKRTMDYTNTDLSLVLWRRRQSL